MFETQFDFCINTSSRKKKINFYQNSIQNTIFFQRGFERRVTVFLMSDDDSPHYQACLFQQKSAERLHFSKLTGMFLKLLAFVAFCLAEIKLFLPKQTEADISH